MSAEAARAALEEVVEVMRASGVASDAQVAAQLGWKRQDLYQLRTGRRPVTWSALVEACARVGLGLVIRRQGVVVFRDGALDE